MEFRLPELGEGVYEAEMTRWLVGVGDRVAPSQGLLEVLTDKATMEVPAPFAGVIGELNVEPGQQLKIGQLVLRYDPLDGSAVVASKPGKDFVPTTPPAPTTNAAAPEPAIKAAPAVRQMARKLGIDLTTIRGTGPEGRILVDDLSVVGQAFLPAEASLRASTEPAATAPSTGLEDSSQAGKKAYPTRVKLQGVRRKIAEQMVRSKTSIPHYTYVDECDVSDLVRIRTGLRDSFAAKGVKLTYLAFVAKAVARALQEVPTVNATFDEAAEELVLADGYELGIAVAAPTGLVVPVVREVLGRSLFDLAREIQRLGEEARAGKTRLEDLRGGSYTLTSIGNLGGLFATPIINQPQVGILGIGKIVRRPVFDSLQRVVPADMVYLSFSFDHRVVDGAIGVAFGNAVVQGLKNPLELFDLSH